MKKKLEVLQEEASDCGICSLASIIKYYGGDISLENLRFYTRTDNNGTNAYELINCAKQLGFYASGEKCENINNINQPVIAHLKLDNNFFHFVVVYKIKKDYLIVMDPSIGFKNIKLVEFNKIFTGVIIKLVPQSIIPKYKKSNFLYLKFIKELKTNKFCYIFIVILTLLVLLFSIISNFEIKILSYDRKLISLLFFMIIFNEIFIFFKNYLILNNSMKLNNNFIISFIFHIFELPLYYLKLKQKGEISTRFNELNELSNNIISFSIDFIFSVFLSFISLISLLFFSFKIFIIVYLISIIYIIFNIIVYRKLLNVIKYSINLEESYNSNILDYISNFETIKHLNIYNYFITKIRSNIDKRNNVVKNINKKIFIVNGINNIIFGIILLFVLFFILDNSFNIVNGLVIYTLLNFYINNLKNIVGSVPGILIFKTYISKSNDFLSFKDDSKKISLNEFKKISINNLFYGINDNVIIKKLSYEIKVLDKIFINGPSGIGKSTLMKILYNEIDRYKGSVMIDNMDIRKYDLSNLITYVSQDERLFNDTLYNNITLGQYVSDDEMNRVLNITKLNDIGVMKIGGLSSLIINESFLSGGEKNRIILARTLIHSKKIIILDEVLKEVDLKLEENIIKSLLEYYKDKTILYISHKDVGYLFERVLTFRKE